MTRGTLHHIDIDLGRTGNEWAAVNWTLFMAWLTHWSQL